MKKMKDYLKRKEKGYYSFYFGMFALVTLLLMSLLMYERLKSEESLQVVENALTTSALGAMIWEPQAVALTKDVIVNHPEEAIDELLTLIGKNLTLSQNGSHYSEIGNNPYFYIENESDCYVKKVILYNVYEDGDIIEYNKDYVNGSYTITTLTSATTPQGENVDTTSLYIEFVYSIRVFGTKFPVKKCEYVTIKDTI